MEPKKKDSSLMAALRPIIEGTETPEQVRQAEIDVAEFRQAELRLALSRRDAPKAEA